MKVLVTGGTGFIGSYVVEELRKAGHAITILARKPEKVSSFVENDGITLMKGDLAEHDVLRECVQGMDAVVHIALGWGDEADTMLQNDTLPSVILMEAAARAGVKHFIYTSSTAAVGEIRPNMGTDIHPRPSDYYGATKAATEGFLLATSHPYEMRCNIIRPGYTFGNPVVPGASVQPDKRFREIVEHAVKGEAVEVTRYDGTQFIWAGDLAKLYRAVLESDVNRRVYHGLARDFLTWEAIAHRAIELCASSSELVVKDLEWASEPSLFDVSDGEKDFGLSFTGGDKVDEHLKHYMGMIDADTFGG